jgi:hypothetical protein
VVKAAVQRIKPGRGFAHLFHLSLVAIIPPLVYVFVRLELYGVALAIVLLSKWRIFAIRPRHWLPHIRTNAVDIMVGLSLLSFMIDAQESMRLQLLWLILFEVWMLYIKPGISAFLVSLQALIAQFVALTALFLSFQEAPLAVYLLASSAITYFCARHFFAIFEEPHARNLSWIWAFFSGCLVWVLGHWLLFYGPIAQPALLLSVMAYGFAGLYYLTETDKLSNLIQRQIIFVMVAVVFVIVIFSNWGDGVIR